MCSCHITSLSVKLPFLHLSSMVQEGIEEGNLRSIFFFCTLPTKKCITLANAVCSQLALVQVLALVSSTYGITSPASSVLIFKVGLIIILFHKIVLSDYTCLLSTDPVWHSTLFTWFSSTYPTITFGDRGGVREVLL